MAHDGAIDRFLHWRQVRDLTGLGRTTAWRLRRTGDFPDPVPISPGRVAWRSRDIALWNETRGLDITFPRPDPPPPRLTQRPPETRILKLKSPTEAQPASKPPPATVVAGKATSAPRTRTRRRQTHSVAEGQLGFDF